MAITTTDPLLGRLVDGRYEIVSRVARGGMATVYLATDRRLDREVAIKVMHPHLADGVDGAAFVSRFRREARAAARLTHPGVVAVYDQGLDGETSYLVMEYVPGENLRRMLHDQGPLDVGRTLDVLAQVLDALAAAHRRQLVHRDVKPENVLVVDPAAGDLETATGHGAAEHDRRDRVKVADFGLARAVTEVTSTATGTILGTVAYLAPEVITSSACDARTDVYAVGVLAYEMLTGTLPYPDEAPLQVAFHHVHEDFPPPSERFDRLPEAVDRFVAACTARDPRARPADAAVALELVGRLRAELPPEVLALRADRPRPPGSGEQDDVASSAASGGAPGLASGSGPVDGEHGGAHDAPAGDADAPDPDAGSTDAVDAIPAGFFQELSAPVAAQPTDVLVEQPTRALASPGTDRPRRGRRRAVAWVLAALLVVGGGGAGAWWWFEDGPGAWTSVPAGVAGVPADDAEAVLADAGLESTTTRTYDDDVPRGSVVTTRPAPGEPVRLDGSVRLVVSRGVEMLDVPDELLGLKAPRATAALEGAGFTVTAPEGEYDDEAAKGTVLAVSVPEGSRQRHDTEVTLTVSDGPAPVQVPQEVGKEKDEAVADLEGLGLRVELAEPRYSEKIPAGHVMKQSPKQGTTAHRTDTVELTVSQGPPLVTVPDVVGMSRADATKALEKAGLEVEENVYLGGLLDTVRFQDTTGEAPKGSTVTVTVW
ncbi:Stk1 family PASTA domain-containing Ser/Thr kinase [Isoptericola sp. BMS4]|uniref:Stk1 family PASTA domain-containing Ser/Thr kinase n=1 Tax=Isoptericola sp. BMS4 TaxID=2527875 RepID=UPI001421D5BA|nr:Stk1 family PASTA domain-containing Ser/Thr kinase [Isoptericola sp. BMS4]